MNYHILETYTLKSIAIDIDKEIGNLIEQLDRLREQKEIIDSIINHRIDRDREKKITSDTVIVPLK